MGLLPFQAGKRKYYMELDLHLARRKTELPVETLDAVFMESSGKHPLNPREIEQLLNKHRTYVRPLEEIQKAALERTKDIIKRAEQSGTEIWLGDVSAKGSYGVVDDIEALASLPFQLWLGRKGNASRRIISLRAAGIMSSSHSHRDLVMAHKIDKLAEITGQQKIGIYAGAGHAKVVELLKKRMKLTYKDKLEIMRHEARGLKMYRCKYNKETNKWEVKEHSL